jgi:pyruvate,water dikinase
VAVRSSGADEDGRRLSYAGLHRSFLDVRGEADVAESVRRCWASAYSVPSLVYRQSHGLPLGLVDLAVIVQQMVRADKSGVVFTVNPVSRRRDELLISAVWGLGEGLVSGALDADTVVVDRLTGALKSVVRAEPGEGGRALSLTRGEIDRLSGLARAIERVFGCPQDIEWSIEGETVHVLQARAITTMGEERPGRGEPRVWDNSNIIESYGGITSPLTYSFARDAYHRIYREYCRLLGVPERFLDDMDEWLAYLLGSHRSRVYYNLLHWYRVIRLTPFYALNRRMLEIALGVQEPLDAATAERLRPIDTESRLARGALRARTALRSWWYFLTIESGVRRFVRDFEAEHRRFDNVRYQDRPAEQVHAEFRRLRRRLLPRWGRMILLEQTIGLAIGLFSVMTRRWLPEAPSSFLYEAARPRGPLASLRPVEAMVELARAVQADPALRAIVESTPSRHLDRALRASADPACRDFVARVDRYVADFGYRSVDELKLEAPDMTDDPSVFYDLLQSVRSSLPAPSREEPPDAVTAYLDDHLRGPRRLAYDAVRRKVQRCLAARERVRFCRTLAFGSARRMLKAIGADLARSGLLDDPRDVFYLRIEELADWFGGALAERDVRGAVAARKTHEAADAAWEAPARFSTHGLATATALDEAGWRPRNTDAPTASPREGAVLHGTPCGPGVAEGVAQVVTEPRDVGGKVLVTYRTDPGWCAVLPSTAALLIERGSPLTHVAIVARELRIPTVVQIPELTKRVRTGSRLRVDGATGVVTVTSR